MLTSKPALLERTYESISLRRTQPYSCYIPSVSIPDSGARYPVLIMLHGFGGDHTSWPNSTRVGCYLADYGIVTVFPNGYNGWYENGYDDGARYEDDIAVDLVREIMRSAPAMAPGRNWAICGMSMGGYGAVRLALKYPRLFSCAVSHGGAFDGMPRSGIHPVFGDAECEIGFRREQSPIWLAEQLLCRFPNQRPFLFLDCALSDPLLEISRSLSGHLKFLGYPHTYSESVGHHTWPYWNRAFRTVLPSVAAHIGAQRLAKNG